MEGFSIQRKSQRNRGVGGAGAPGETARGARTPQTAARTTLPAATGSNPGRGGPATSATGTAPAYFSTGTTIPRMMMFWAKMKIKSVGIPAMISEA